MLIDAEGRLPGRGRPPPSGLHGTFAVLALTRPVLDVTEPLSSEEVEV